MALFFWTALASSNYAYTYISYVFIEDALSESGKSSGSNDGWWTTIGGLGFSFLVLGLSGDILYEYIGWVVILLIFYCGVSFWGSLGCV